MAINAMYINKKTGPKSRIEVRAAHKVLTHTDANIHFYFQIISKTMKKNFFFFKNWLFSIRKKKAIKQAQQLANEQRRKFLVLNLNGKPTVVSMKQIKHWIRTKQVHKDADYFRKMALYTARPQ